MLTICNIPNSKNQSAGQETGCKRAPPAWFERNRWSLLSCCRSSDDVFNTLGRLLIHFLTRVFAAGAATLASTSAFAAEWREKWIKGTDRWLNKWDQINQSTFLLPLSEFIPPSPLSLSPLFRHLPPFRRVGNYLLCATDALSGGSCVHVGSGGKGHFSNFNISDLNFK